jgi:uncharacterized membrane protein
MNDHQTPAESVAEQTARAVQHDGRLDGPLQAHSVQADPAQAGQMHEGQQQPLHREEFFDLVEHVVMRLQTVGGPRIRLRRQGRAEPRWPVSTSVIVAIVLQALLSSNLALQPRWLIPALEGALLLALVVANPVRIERLSGRIRAASVALIALITAANAVSAALLIKAIVTSQVHTHNAPVALLASGAAIWGTNVIAFALWYWEFDRGGPVLRLQGKRPYPDLLFPQMTTPELTPPGWGPRFVDYLYMSFTNATAFSPTDIMPLARWAKLTMLVQAGVSLSLGALVIARAVNII